MIATRTTNKAKPTSNNEHRGNGRRRGSTALICHSRELARRPVRRFTGAGSEIQAMRTGTRRFFASRNPPKTDYERGGQAGTIPIRSGPIRRLWTVATSHGGTTAQIRRLAGRAASGRRKVVNLLRVSNRPVAKDADMRIGYLLLVRSTARPSCSTKPAGPNRPDLNRCGSPTTSTRGTTRKGKARSCGR